MKLRKSPRAVKLAVLAVIALSAALVIPSSADAAIDDSFTVTTIPTPDCASVPFPQPADYEPAGAARYVDYGPGSPANPANNDDYIVVADICSEGDGVKAWAWLNGKCLESCAGRYVHGVGATSYWDPFPDGEVKKGGYVGLKVCSVDGNSGPPYNCLSHTGYSDDG
jgi:hypothetical protein